MFRFSWVESSVGVSLSLNEAWFVFSLSLVASSVGTDVEFDKSLVGVSFGLITAWVCVEFELGWWLHLGLV